jgi:hypothetical protein
LLKFIDSFDYKLYSVIRLAHTDRGYLYVGDLCFLSSRCWDYLGFD